MSLTWTYATKDDFCMRFDQLYVTWNAQAGKELTFQVSNREIKRSTLGQKFRFCSILTKSPFLPPYFCGFPAREHKNLSLLYEESEIGNCYRFANRKILPTSSDVLRLSYSMNKNVTKFPLAIALGGLCVGEGG